MRTLRRDDGSSVIELVYVAPLLIVVLMFLVMVGRLATSRLEVAEVAHSAVRAASLAATPQLAISAATRVLETIPASASCDSHSLTVDTTAFRPGGVVKVTVSCRIRLRDITGIVPDTTTITESSLSPIDPFRAVNG